MQTIPPLKASPFMISSNFLMLHFISHNEDSMQSKALPALTKPSFSQGDNCFAITSPFNSESLSINEEKKNFTRDKVLGSKVF